MNKELHRIVHTTCDVLLSINTVNKVKAVIDNNLFPGTLIIVDKVKIKTMTVSVRLGLTRDSNGSHLRTELGLMCVLDGALTDPVFNSVDLDIVKYLYGRDGIDYLITLVSKLFEKAELC